MATMTIARPLSPVNARTEPIRAPHGIYAPQFSTGARVRLTRRGRIVVGFMAAFATLVLMMGVTVVGSPALIAADVPATQSHTVLAGETLWSIAAASAGSGDVQAVLYEIRRINELTTSQIAPGQVLLVPAR